jgi:hypothetical protein
MALSRMTPSMKNSRWYAAACAVLTLSVSTLPFTAAAFDNQPVAAQPSVEVNLDALQRKRPLEQPAAPAPVESVMPNPVNATPQRPDHPS